MRKLLIVPVLLIFGCDQGPKMGTVTGAVTYGGQPVTEGTIQFFPTQPGPMAASRLGEDGTYELSTKQSGDGAQVGDYVVVVVPPSDVNRLQRELKPGQPWSAKFDEIPESIRSEHTSNLTATVASGKNTFDFDLKDPIAGE